MSATAMVFHGAGQPLQPTRFPKPSLGTGEAWVRVRLCTLCGSDLHTITGRRTEPTPCVLGHEIVGEIEEIGPGGTTDVRGEPVRMGDRVVWSVAVSCGVCFFCTHELPQKCVSLAKYGHLRAEPGRGPFGGLSTHCHLLRGTTIVKVPETLPDAIAAPAMCATATVMAAFRVGGTVASDGVILVVGLGLLGLTACAIAKSRGYTVLACDRDAERVTIAARFGADRGFLVADGGSELRDHLRMATLGAGADVALELTGSVSATQMSLNTLRIGGILVLVGAVMPTDSLPLSPEMVVRRCLTIRGVHNYIPTDLAAAVDWLNQNHGQFPFAEMIGSTYALADADRAFRYAEEHRPIRIAIRSEL